MNICSKVLPPLMNILPLPLPLYFHSWIFSLSSKNKKKSPWPYLSKMDRHPRCRINGTISLDEKKGKRTHNCTRFAEKVNRIDPFPSPERRSSVKRGVTKLRATKSDGYFLSWTRGREAKGGKEMADERLFSFSRSSASVLHATKPRFDPPPLS